MANTVARLSSDPPLLSSTMGQQLSDLAMKVFGCLPVGVDHVGGNDRNAFLVDMGDRSYFFTKRGRLVDARIEARVLRMLEPSVHTPRLKANVEDWIVQEYLEGTRLPVLLNSLDSMKKREKAVSSALEALLHIYALAEKLNMKDQLPIIGEQRDWFVHRLQAAKRLSKDTGIGLPDVDYDLLLDTFSAPRDQFIKYDARPGNTLVDGNLAYWFDWEDCGAGNTLEDLAFVLCDEWTAIDADTEEQLIDRFLPFFRQQKSHDEALHYLTVYGVIQTTVRLRMALKYRMRDGKWWDRDECLSGDKVGVTQTETARLCERGKRWSQRLPELKGFEVWFNEIKGFFEIPDHKELLPTSQAA